MPGLTVFQKRLTSTALRQFEKFHLLRENQQPLKGQVQTYWVDLGLTFDKVSVPWSAVFVSWCIKTAGATADQFRFAAAHSKFINWAIKNANGGTGLFHAHPPNSYAPKPGDLLQNNRGQNKYTFEFAATHTQYESHSAVVIEVGADNVGRYLRTIGGNESDSVGLKEVRLNANGQVRNPDGLYISVVETLM